MTDIKQKYTIGVDYGGVCSIHAAQHEDGKFNGNTELNVPGCVEALTELKTRGHKLVLISFCGKARADATNKYFAKYYPDLFDVVIFVKKRTLKNQHCIEQKVDFMIDDRLDVLETITTAKKIWFTLPEALELIPKKDVQNANNVVDHHVRSWEEVLELFK